MKNKTVLAFGTFDGVHPGHEHFLHEAKELGDRLVVVIALDETVIKVKGHAPKFSQNQRLAQVQAVADVDQAVLGYPGDKYKIVEEVHPDLIALGYDQSAFIEGLKPALAERHVDAEIVRLNAFHPQKYKSSLLNQES